MSTQETNTLSANMNGTGHTEARRQQEPTPSVVNEFRVAVSVRFLITSLLASTLLAFCVGRAARITLLGKGGIPVAEQCDVQPHKEVILPAFIAKNGQAIPPTRYTSKHFDSPLYSSSSSWLAANREKVTLVEEREADLVSGGKNDESCLVETEDEEQKVMVAEHLMVEIKNVDGSFLNSERRLVNAMLEVINEAELTLLSYHCHGLVPTGVSCVGILKENYISFHTWPEGGVITLDLCVGNSGSLLPVVPMIERVFGVPHSHGDTPEILWVRKLRGFPEAGTVTDLFTYVINDFAVKIKDQVASIETDFQTIDIFDVAHNQNETLNLYDKDFLIHDAPHLPKKAGRPNRMIFLDGWTQSALLSEHVYHEALVHPALFAHVNPKRVAIVGGGEGATLREVLKHNTVEEAIMVEIDENMVNVSREYIPEWSDCRDIKGSASWCGDDPRASIYYEDAFAWFIDRYGGSKKSQEHSRQIDVIIMDAL